MYFIVACYNQPPFNLVATREPDKSKYYKAI